MNPDKGYFSEQILGMSINFFFLLGRGAGDCFAHRIRCPFCKIKKWGRGGGGAHSGGKILP